MIGRKVLIFGGAGLVGSRFIELVGHNLSIKSPDVSEIDILKTDQVQEIVKSYQPDIVINFAAFTDVQGAEEQKDDKEGSCYQINVVGAKQMAEVCEKMDISLIHLSTDYVFDGEKGVAPYIEDDEPNPQNWYGQTKYWGEGEVLKSGCRSTIVRISMPFSAHYGLKKDIARFFLDQLREGHKIYAITDQKVTPALVDDVANALYALIQKGSGGLYHVVSTTWTTPFDLATLIARAFSLDESLIKQITLDEYNKNKKAKLLKYSWLDSSKFISEFGENILHSVEESVNIFTKQVGLDSVGVDESITNRI